MRRTEQEFKEEVLKRTRAYRQKQVKMRRSLLAASLCICLCVVVVSVLNPFRAATMDSVKMEAVVFMEAPAAPMPEEAMEEDVVLDCAEDVISKV